MASPGYPVLGYSAYGTYTHGEGASGRAGFGKRVLPKQERVGLSPIGAFAGRRERDLGSTTAFLTTTVPTTSAVAAPKLGVGGAARGREPAIGSIWRISEGASRASGRAMRFGLVALFTATIAVATTAQPSSVVDRIEYEVTRTTPDGTTVVETGLFHVAASTGWRKDRFSNDGEHTSEILLMRADNPFRLGDRITMNHAMKVAQRGSASAWWRVPSTRARRSLAPPAAPRPGSTELQGQRIGERAVGFLLLTGYRMSIPNPTGGENATRETWRISGIPAAPIIESRVVFPGPNGDTSIVQEQRITTMERVPTSDDLFTIPDGYRVQEMGRLPDGGGTLMRRAADAVTILVGVVALFVIVGRSLPPEVPTLDVVEQHLDPSIVDVDFATAEATLIMVLRSDCPYCQESMPFYRRLLERNTADLQVVVAAPTRDTGINDYLASEGVNPDSVVLVEEGALPVPGTPTLLLVDGEGLVTHAWIRLLNAEREEEVIEAVLGWLG